MARWLVDRNPVVTTLIERKARRETAKKTRGKYPAIDAALPLVVQGPRTSLRDAAEKEAAAIARLATGPVCKNLVALFLAQHGHFTRRAHDQDGAGTVPFLEIQQRPKPAEIDGSVPVERGDHRRDDVTENAFHKCKMPSVTIEHTQAGCAAS